MAKKNNTILYIGGGIGLLYVLSKLNLSGAIGKGLGDIIDTTVSGGGTVVKEVIEGTAQGVWHGFENIVKPAGQSISNSAVRVASGNASTGDWLASFSPVGGFGLSAAMAKSVLAQSMPHSTVIIKSSGYKTDSGRTYIDAKYQTRAADISALLKKYSSAGDVAYLMAVKEGKDVSRWNTQSLTDSFRQAMGV